MVSSGFLLRTDAFESCAPKPHFVNERCFGDDFASWLHDRLVEQAIATSEPIQEDWGWALLVTVSDHRFVVSIGIMDESIGASPASWHVGLTYERMTNKLQHLFRKPDEAAFALARGKLEAILTREPRFTVIERT